MNSMQGYANEIVKELEKKYDVEYLSNACRIEKKKLSFYEKVIKSFAKDLKIKYFIRKYEKIEKCKFREAIGKLNNDYDYLIDFAAGSNPLFMDLFIQKNPKTKKILFIWDDLEYHKESKKLMEYFDKIYTYNQRDAKKYNINYRPSFFLDIFKYNDEKKDIDVFYVATMREEKRAELASLIDKNIGKNNYIKLIHKLRYKDFIFKRKYLKFKNYYTERNMDVYELANYYKKSKILLDISFTGQLGLGLRPIEAIASKCKLITTNKDIKNYDFYNKNNIFVIENNSILGIEEFIKNPYIDLQEDIQEKYSLKFFLEDIID